MSGSTAVVVSADAHIGPRVEQDLRPLVPRGYLDDFDAWRRSGVSGFKVAPGSGGKARQARRNLSTAGHYDVATRLRDMDGDGVAAEVVYHDSTNGELMPFQGNGLLYDFTKLDFELLAVGYDVYNRWLGAALGEHEPERHAGLAYLPLWDVDAAVPALEKARELGLRAVNFPAPRPGLPEYDDPQWEPFYVACASLGMPLCTHAGGAPIASDGGAHGGALRMLEIAGWPARRAMHRMVLGGVFERHPNLKLVFTEITGGWWASTMRELDSAWAVYESVLTDQCPRPPSAYCQTNVFLGMSFPAPFETAEAVRDGFIGNVMWGSDYPHPEGTWQLPDETTTSTTHESLRYAAAALSARDAAAFVGDTACRVFGLDRAKLRAVAERIAAPTVEDIATPLPELPHRDYSLAFRTQGPWA